ncbi:hypothetical protein [Alsobacter sp. SYSU BS001988]
MAETLNKLEAVERLLIAAIRMIIFREDVLAANLLATSAHNFLNEYEKAKGLTMSRSYRRMMEGKRLEEGFKATSRVANFLKHADRDPDAVLEVPDLVAMTDLVIFGSIENYRSLTGGIGSHMHFFMIFFLAQNPDLLASEAITMTMVEEWMAEIKGISSWSRERLCDRIGTLIRTDPKALAEAPVSY